MIANLPGAGGGVVPGNERTSKLSSPHLWKFLDSLAPKQRSWPFRGDAGFGNEPMMREAARPALSIQAAADEEREAAIGQSSLGQAPSLRHEGHHRFG
jgi:hypothetical protein